MRNLALVAQAVLLALSLEVLWGLTEAEVCSPRLAKGVTYDPPAEDVCDEACREETHQALLKLHEALSARAAKQDMWPEPDYHCNACNKTRPDVPTGYTPPYCCWRGVDCCKFFKRANPDTICKKYSVVRINFREMDLAATLDEALAPLKQLQGLGLLYLELDANDLTGTIPTDISLLSRLKGLSLSNNYLAGTLPAEALAGMPALESLDLNFNLLTGTIGSALCLPDSSQALQSLFLRANGFTGELNLRGCTNLTNVDIQDNDFSGTLPVGLSNFRLSMIRLRNNRIGGQLPEECWLLPNLAVFDAANNSLVGSLSSRSSYSNVLSFLVLSNNSLSGTIPESLGAASQLTVFDVSLNRYLYGTLPDFSKVMGLHTLSVRDTQVNGSIPASLGDLPFLTNIDIRNTLMTCCDSKSDAEQRYKNRSLLPGFLMFTDEKAAPMVQLAPSPDNLSDPGSNMVCHYIKRDLAHATVNTVLEPVNLTQGQSWDIDPEYFWFQSCDCLAGYTSGDATKIFFRRWCDTGEVYGKERRAYNLNKNMCITLYVLACNANPNTQIIILATVLTVCMCILVLLIYCLCCRRVSKLQRQLRHIKQRAAGLPRSGKMSIVVTDIEGYSDMMKRSPEQTIQALSTHNAVIRKAKFANCGFTLEQEGDSYVIVFTNTLDAVAFCLQVQQALLREDWPALLDPAADARGLTQSPSGVSIQGTSDGRGFFRIDKRAKSGRVFQSMLSSSPEGVNGTGSFASPADKGERSKHTSRAEQMPRMFSSRPRLAELFKSSSQDQKLFHGMRVRMGVATGYVETDSYTREGIKNSPLHRLAKSVSDAANGGQVLLCHRTFKDIVDCLHPLGATDANGLNYRKMSSKKSALDMMFCKPAPEADEALILDMGEYESPLLPRLPFAPIAADLRGKLWPFWSCVSQLHWQLHRSHQQMNSHLPTHQHPARHLQASNSPHHPSGSMDKTALAKAPNRVRLYQILAPALAERAWFWGNRLSLEEDWHCTDMPYFDAPGALQCPPSTHSSSTRTRLASLAVIPTAQPQQTPHQQQQQWEQAGGSSCHGQLNSRVASPLEIRHSSAPAAHGELLPSPGPSSSPGPGSSRLSLEGPRGTSPGLNGMQHGSMLGPQPGGLAELQLSVIDSAVSEVSTDLEPIRSTAAAAGGQGPSFLVPVIPPVTMVFLSIEGASSLLRRRSVSREIHHLLSLTLREVLRYVPGGYWCQQWPGDLKYMLAFATPRAAVEWCLLVQEAGMYLPWSPAVLNTKGCGVELDREGGLAFRGPRMKVGVCQGVPQRIMADHMGRADYYGPSINQAARYMDVAAHGGHVVLDYALMKQVVLDWQRAAGGQLARAGELPQQQQQWQLSGAASQCVAQGQDVGEVGAVGPPRSPTSPPANGSVPATWQAQPQEQEEGDMVVMAEPPQQQQPRRSQEGSGSTSSSRSLPLGNVPSNGSTKLSTISYSSAAATLSPSWQGSGMGPAHPTSGSISKRRSGAKRLGSLLQGLYKPKRDSQARIAVEGAEEGLERGGLPGSTAAAAGAAAHFGSGSSTMRGEGPLPSPDGAVNSRASRAVAGVPLRGQEPRYGLDHVGSCPATVDIHWCGMFHFKGHAEVVPIVRMQLAALSGRHFPAEPPKGKGSCKQVLTDLVEVVAGVPLPDLLGPYRALMPMELRQLSQFDVGANVMGLHADMGAVSIPAAAAAVAAACRKNPLCIPQQGCAGVGAAGPGTPPRTSEGGSAGGNVMGGLFLEAHKEGLFPDLK